MRINISDISKNHGASLNVEIHEVLPELKSVQEEYTFDEPIDFKGRLVNYSGILKLSGNLNVKYKTGCFRCLKELDGSLNIVLEEEFVEADKDNEGDYYTYSGHFIELSKVFIDNILLNLPTRRLCSDDCKGICPQCGCDLNTCSCECIEDFSNPQMEALKDFFNND